MYSYIFICISARGARAAACLICIGFLLAICVAAGVTWTRVSASAPWAARRGHTSVIDAAGAIYVLGGRSGGFSTYYNDVWKSIDGGAHRTRAGAVEVLPGVLGGTRGVLAGYCWVTRSTQG